VENETKKAKCLQNVNSAITVVQPFVYAASNCRWRSHRSQLSEWHSHRADSKTRRSQTKTSEND
jgi:hypothetical protein